MRAGLEHSPNEKGQCCDTSDQMLLFASHVWSLHVKVGLLARFDAVCGPLQATGSTPSASVHRTPMIMPDFSVSLLGVPTTQGNRMKAMKVFEL